MDIVGQLIAKHMNLIAENILWHLDDISLKNCESVSKTWYLVIRNGNLWKLLYNNVSHKNPLLQALLQVLFKKSQDSHSRQVVLANFYKIHVSICSAGNLKPTIKLTVMNFYSRDCSVPDRI